MATRRRKRRLFSLKGRQNLPWWMSAAIAGLIRMLGWTYRVRLHDPHGFLQSQQPWPVVFLLWHNRIAFLANCFPRSMRERSAVLISASRDGAYASDVIRRFGIGVVRGSTSRGGHGALRQLRKTLREGTSAVITLDGPRGPRYEVQPGAAALSQLCDVPFVPISLNARSRWEARGWDRTQVPKPFSRVEVYVGAPVRLTTGSVFRNRGEACTELRNIMLSITDDSRKGDDPGRST
jgi:lysophospholipid acyltransferase (LPLAT)-like uncharacterized protein